MYISGKPKVKAMEVLGYTTIHLLALATIFFPALQKTCLNMPMENAVNQVRHQLERTSGINWKEQVSSLSELSGKSS